MSAKAGLGFIAAVETCLRKYAVFQGRAPRAEYWWFVLFQLVLLASLALLIFPAELHRMAAFRATGVMPPQGAASSLLGLVFDIVNLGLLLPAISVTVRRLHDKNKSGWWYFFPAIPLIGPILMLVWFCTRGTAGGNRFGPDPLRDF